MTPMQEFFQSCLERRGFTVTSTGGGCTAWQWHHLNHEILITQDSSHEIEEEYLEDQGICFTVYTDWENNEFDTYWCTDYFEAREAITWFQQAIEFKAEAERLFKLAIKHAPEV